MRGLTEKGGRETEGQAGRDVGQESEAAVRGEAEGSGDRESNGECARRRRGGEQPGRGRGGRPLHQISDSDGNRAGVLTMSQPERRGRI